jgi:hypothetical protein
VGSSLLLILSKPEAKFISSLFCHLIWEQQSVYETMVVILYGKEIHSLLKIFQKLRISASG